MGKKVISFGLSTEEIDKAVRELTDYKQELIRKTELLRERVAERIAEEAQSGFMGAIVDDQILTGGVSSPIYAGVNVSIDDRGSVTAVIANGEDAVWVEFGAGVHYNGTPGLSPHPNGAELGLTIGSFGKGKGKKETWGFYEDGELKLSRGTPARMPMSRAVAAVCNEISEMAKEVFG